MLEAQVLFVTLAGQVMVGAGMRITTTLKVQLFVKHRLVTVQVTGVDPALNVLPLAGTQPRRPPPLTVGAG